MVKPSKRGLIVGNNDLLHKSPQLAKEWHPTKNLGVTPSEVLSTTEQKAWWTCELGHDWEANVRNRYVLGSGCPFCSGRRVLVGQNDLVTTHPKIAAEWHTTKNKPVLPTEVSAGVGKKYWWQCKEKHEWNQSPNARTNMGLGCPFCSGRKVSVGQNDLVTTHPKIAAEWHTTKNKPVLPTEVSAGVGRKYWWQCKEKHEWLETPNARTRKGRGNCPVCSNRRIVAGVNDFVARFPELSKKWHPTKNVGLDITSVSLGQPGLYWWVCEQGHAYRCSASNLVRGRGCGVCANRQVEPGVNDLETTHPELAAQWHPEKNGDLLPSGVIATTSRSVWWLCEFGHTWISKGEWRVRTPGCPVCSNRTRIPVIGQNDLATTHPKLAKMWHPTKNNGTTQQMVFAGAGEARWWICSLGHEFRATGDALVSGVTCGVCANRQIQVGVNDMQTTHPDLATQWHPVKNLPLTPQSVIGSHSGKLWWVCQKGHEFISTGYKRSQGTGCPVCLNQKVLTGFNDLSTVNPHLAQDWHVTKNGGLTPDKVLCGGHGKYWWVCKEGHEWRTDITSRLAGTGCPRCANSGFDSTKPGILYFISNIQLRSFKVGITNSGATRLDRFVKAGWNVEYKYESRDGELIRMIETNFFRWLRGELRIPRQLGKLEMGSMGGHSETFSDQALTASAVIEQIKRLQKVHML
jgi:hypothetical protein